MKNKGRLIVFSAPSGCGKGTMLAEILKDKRFCCSISATTRKARENETDGINYYFISKDDFEQKINNGDFLEYTCYCGNYYGTLISEVENRINSGMNVILEIEVEGAMKIREIGVYKDNALFIFIAPPSINELRRRLKKRGTESDEVIEKRVAQAANEIPYAKKYDYIIVNAALEDAVDDFFSVIHAEELKSDAQSNFIDEVIRNA